MSVALEDHGTTRQYGRGCRCADCKSAWHEYQRQWRRTRLADPACPHGDRVTYLSGCRCKECRSANAAYNMSRKQRLASKAEVPHGVNGYSNYGCRCDICVQAKRVETRDYYFAHQIEALEKAAKRRLLISHDRKVVTAKDIRRLINRHDGRCFYCSVKPVNLEIDHVVPLSRGGRHAVGNLVPACRRCNRSKHARLVVEWRQR